jgi:hypothetical protein
MLRRGSDCTRIESVNTIIYYFNFGDEVIKFLMSAFDCRYCSATGLTRGKHGEGLQHGAQGAS